MIDNLNENLEEYEANIDVTVVSNKNENVYNMQQIVDEEFSRVIVNGPENVKGLEIELKDGNLKIINTKTNMEKIYENYKTEINNSLFINSFIEEYKNNDTEIVENESEIIIKMNLEKDNNTYKKIKELYLDKQSGLPIKLLIKDNVQNTNTSIVYNDIKIK